MGANSSGLTQEELQEYAELLYLNKTEIIRLYKRTCSMGPEVQRDRTSRYPKYRVELAFPELRWNPFLDRICTVFSSADQESLSFEDLLNLYSVLNKKCPDDVKALWAFRLFDIDGDGQLGPDDLVDLLSRLTTSKGKAGLLDEEKMAIAKKILLDLDLDKTGGITCTEFSHAVTKIPDFSTSFRL